MNRLTLSLRRIRRLVLARRRLLAGLTAAVAVAAGLQAATGPPPATVPVLTAAHDITAGSVLTAADLARVRFAPGSVPEGVAGSRRQVVGRTATVPIRAGEPITDVRLLAGSMLAGYPGMVAAPVRVGDAGAVNLLRVGDRVDILAADPRGAEEAAVVADEAAVIAIPEPSADAAAAQPGALIVVAVPDRTARAIAAAGVARYLSIVLTH